MYGPSAMTLQSPFPHEVKEVTVKKFAGIIEDYRRAAQNCHQSGFDGLEISSAQRLLSKPSSQRSQAGVQMSMAVRH